MTMSAPFNYPLGNRPVSRRDVRLVIVCSRVRSIQYSLEPGMMATQILFGLLERSFEAAFRGTDRMLRAGIRRFQPRVGECSNRRNGRAGRSTGVGNDEVVVPLLVMVETLTILAVKGHCTTQ